MLKKPCSQCAKTLSLGNFHSRGGGLLRSECKKCRAENDAGKYWRNRPDRVSPVVDDVPVEAPVQNEHVNAFSWRQFVQPVAREYFDPLREANRYEGART